MPPHARSEPDDDEEDDDDDIGEYVVEGKALKRMLKRGRLRTVPFAFCPVAGDETTWFATHKKKSPALIAKRTRRESGQFKVAFGTFVVEGRLLLLTCVELLPNLAKRVKKHLARENIRMSVRALDADGTEFDADVEDFADEDPLADDDEDEPGDRPAPRAGGGGGAPADSFAARLERVQGAVLAARGEAGNRLRQLLGGAYDAQDRGDRQSAETLLDRLEEHVRQLMNSAARPAVAPAPKPAARPPEHVGAAPDRQEQVRLARSVRALRSRIGLLEGSAEARLLAALAIGARQIRGGDLAGAEETIGRVAAALERAEARAQEARA